MGERPAGCATRCAFHIFSNNVFFWAISVLLIDYDQRGVVIAPCDADETSDAYFANTPLGYRGCGAFHCAMRCWSTSSLTSTSSTRVLTSKRIMSPSRTPAMGPPRSE